MRVFIPLFSGWKGPLKVIKQQYAYVMSKREGVKHLKDGLSHGLKPNIHNALHYIYDKPDSQYS